MRRRLLHRAFSLPVHSAATGAAPVELSVAASAPGSAGERLVHAALGQDCFYAQPNGGWWRFEVCPSARVRQYHTAPDGTVDTVINLGTFDAQARLA